MKIFYGLIKKIAQSIPPSSRRRLIDVVDRFFDLARKEHYGNYGEDAFVQAYYRQQAIFAGAPFHILKNAIERGFYVDVGAYSPRHLSNTYWFYRHGWRGINIDATPGSMNAFRRVRPRDVNIEAAVSDQEDTLIFYTWDTPRFVNTLSPDHAAHFADTFGEPPRQIQVPAFRLETLLDRFLPKDQKVSFLSVDVEKHDLL